MDWFRLYDSIIDDPKTLRLSPELRWFYVGMLAISSRQPKRGTLPSAQDIALHLRVSDRKAVSIVDTLTKAGFIDKSPSDNTLRMHGWDQRQRASDDVSARVRDHRARNPATLRKRDGNDTRARALLETEADTEAEAEQKPLPPPPQIEIHPTDSPKALQVVADAQRRWGKIDLDAETQANEMIRCWGAELVGRALDKALRSLGTGQKPWAFAAKLCREGMSEGPARPRANGSVEYRPNPLPVSPPPSVGRDPGPVISEDDARSILFRKPPA